MKTYNFAKIAAICSAITLFFLSTSKLINFAFSQGAINKSEAIVRFFIDNNKDINIFSIILLFASFLVILFSYFLYAKNNNQKFLKYMIIFLGIVFSFSTISELSRYIEILDLLAIELKIMKIILSISIIFFSLAILIYNKNRKKALLIIAPFYILQSLFIISTSFLPVQLLDLMIAIRISESVFFHQESKNA